MSLSVHWFKVLARAPSVINRASSVNRALVRLHFYATCCKTVTELILRIQSAIIRSNCREMFIYICLEKLSSPKIIIPGYYSVS